MWECQATCLAFEVLVVEVVVVVEKAGTMVGRVSTNLKLQLANGTPVKIATMTLRWRRQRSSRTAGQSQKLKERANSRGGQAVEEQTGLTAKARSLRKCPNPSRKLTWGHQ